MWQGERKSVHHVDDFCTNTQHSPWCQHRAGAVPGAGDAVTKVMASEQSFTTSPPVGAGSQLRFIAWADSGQATYDGTNEYDYSEVGAELHTACVVLQSTHNVASYVSFSQAAKPSPAVYRICARGGCCAPSEQLCLCSRGHRHPSLFLTQLVLIFKARELAVMCTKAFHGACRTTTL